VLDVETAAISQISYFILANSVIQTALRTANRGFETVNERLQATRKVEDVLLNITLGRDEIKSIYIFANNYYIFSLNIDPQRAIPLPEAEIFDTIREVSGSLLWLETDPQSEVVIAARVITDLLTQKVIGFAIIHVKESFFYNIYRSLRLSNLGEFFILSGDGRVVSHKNKSLLNTRLSDDYILKILESHSNQFFTEKINGEAFYISSHVIPDFNWRLVSIVPVNNFRGQIYYMLITMIFLALVSWILAIGIGIVISKNISQPLKSLLVSINKMKEGNQSLPVVWESHDEIGMVINAYNDMILNLSTVEDFFIKSEDEYRSLFENAAEGIFYCAPNGLIGNVNQAFADILGFSSPKEMLELKLNIKDILMLDNREDKDILKFIHNQGNIRNLNALCIKKDNSIIHVSLNFVIVTGDDGEISHMEGMMRDMERIIQDEKEKAVLQFQLQNAKKLEAIGTLAGGIAHDFNNILGAIVGYTELGLSEVSKDTSLYIYLNEMLNAGLRAKDLVKQILAFSRQSKGERKPIEIVPVIKEALKLLRASLPASISIKENIDVNAGIIRANPTQIHQIIMNLCTNAGHAMSENGGLLEVILQNREIDEIEAERYSDISSGSYVELIVRDTGKGIEENVLDKIFDPYFTTKEKGKGTGLGLAVVHGIVKSYGGSISVNNKMGQNTSFHVFFPAILKDLDQTVKHETKAIPTGKERILFVDDEQVIVELTKKMLNDLGYHVVVRTSSLEALELFKNKPEDFDVVITDINMPNMCGDELAKEILKIRPDIPIILCTGYYNLISDKKAKKIGIKCFIYKPIILENIAQTLRQVLDNRNTSE